MADNPQEIDIELFKKYRTIYHYSISQECWFCKEVLFTAKANYIDCITPTLCKQLWFNTVITYQAGHVWNHWFQLQELPLYTKWHPLWTKLPNTTRVCHKLIKCGCKQDCRGCCKSNTCMYSNACVHGWMRGVTNGILRNLPENQHLFPSSDLYKLIVTFLPIEKSTASACDFDNMSVVMVCPQGVYFDSASHGHIIL